jgi:hypothetical protein
MVAHLVKRLTKLGYVVELREPAPHVGEVSSGETAASNESGGSHVAAVAATTRKRGRPCKCKERGIICRHGTSVGVNSLHSQTVEAGEFS